MKTTSNGAVMQRVIKQLRLDKIRRDGGTQSREKLCSETAGQYAEAIDNGAEFPEIVVFFDGKEYWLAAGFHRWEAHDILGRKCIDAEVIEGTLRDAILYSVRENHAHGLPRNNKDKRHCCRMILEDEEWWEKADAWVAEACGVSRPLVVSIREEMEKEWELEEKKRQEEEARKAEEEKKRQQSGSGASSSCAGAAHEKGKPKPGNGSRQRVGRSKHGGTRIIETGNQQGKGGNKVKPVLVETETREIAKKMAQIVRSIPKAIKQAKSLGWSWEKYVEENRLIWDEIPVAEE